MKKLSCFILLIISFFFAWCYQSWENQQITTDSIQGEYFYAQWENPFRYINISPEITWMMRKGKDDYEEKKINLTHSGDNYLLNWESMSLIFEFGKCLLNNQSYDYKVTVHLSWEVYQWCGNNTTKEHYKEIQKAGAELSKNEFSTQQACEESLKWLSSEKITDEITIIPWCTTIQKDETHKTYVAGYFYTYHFNDFWLTLETSNYTDIFQTKRETPFFVISGNKLLFLDPTNNNLSDENYYLERYEKEINENLEEIITKKHLGKECIIMKEENEDDFLSGIYQNQYYLIMQDPSIRDNAEKPREIQWKCISDPESNGNALFFESQDRTHYYKYVSTDWACFPNACHPIEKIEVL